MIGETGARFKILDELGEGGTRRTQLAEDPLMARKVALKFFPPHLREDDKAPKQFPCEADSAALHQPCISKLYKVVQADGGRYFIAMEQVARQTVRQQWAVGPLPLNAQGRSGSRSMSP